MIGHHMLTFKKLYSDWWARCQIL